MKRIMLLLLILTAAALLVAGCSTDDPVKPVPEPVPDPVATTPDSLLALYRIALEEMDADLYRNLLGSDFRMWLDESEGDFGELPTPYLTGSEALSAAGNMFSGEPVTNWQGTSIPGVTRFTIHQWEKVTEWAAPQARDEMPPPPPGETVSSLWALRMFVERGTGYPIMSAAGLYEIQAEKVRAEDDQDFWVLRYLLPVPDGKTENFGWTGVNLYYLTNEPPQAVLTVSEQPGDPWPEFTFDPSGSADEDSGLGPQPFRYRIGREPFMPPENWTDWTADPLVVTFETEGGHTVTLEVRDRWGATARTERTVAVALDR